MKVLAEISDKLKYETDELAMLAWFLKKSKYIY